MGQTGWVDAITTVRIDGCSTMFADSLHNFVPLAVVLAPSIAWGQMIDVGDVLSGRGIAPIKPPSAAPDFSLPDLEGAQHDLSDTQGRWVLLTFFATWCGPCKEEMPSLQGLAAHQTELDVIAVSIDQQVSALRRFVKSNRISLLVLHDATGQVGNQYRASAVPVSYIIDPTGRIVGVARGARDWAQLEPMFDELLGLVPSDPAAAPAYVATDSPVDLPTEFTPPTAIVTLVTPSLTKTTVDIGQPFALDVQVHWAGNFDDYLLHPPVVHLPEGVVQSGTSAETNSRDGRSTVTYHLALEAIEAGTFDLDPVELRYTPRFEEEPLTTQIKGPEVVVEAKASWLLPLVVAGSALGTSGLMAVGLGAFYWHRRQKPAVTVDDTYERLNSLFEEARQLRIAGDAAGFMERVATL
ncbi:MAG: redoxin domain-containing protein, partial [Proteobacteria bacterium]|nr:redoxin domain-containing protein [Pseudomonadota bacterium]